MARTRSTRKSPARSTAKKPAARSATPKRGPAAAKKTSADSRGAAKAKPKASASQASDAEFRAEVEALVDKLTSARRPWALRRARQEFERSYVNHIIRRSDMDRQRAATRLDIGFSTLKEKIRTP